MTIKALQDGNQSDGGKAKGQLGLLSAKLVALAKQIGKDYEIILVADRTGKIIADNLGGEMVGVDLSERGYYQSAMSGKVDASDVVRSKKSKKPVAVVAAPVKQDNGTVIGMVGLVLNIDFLNRKVTGFKVGQTGYAWAANSQGAIYHASQSGCNFK